MPIEAYRHRCVRYFIIVLLIIVFGVGVFDIVYSRSTHGLQSKMEIALKGTMAGAATASEKETELPPRVLLKRIELVPIRTYGFTCPDRTPGVPLE